MIRRTQSVQVPRRARQGAILERFALAPPEIPKLPRVRIAADFMGQQIGCTEQARLQLTREPRSLPQLVIKDRGQGLFDYEPEDFAFKAYDPHPHISAPVAV